MSEVELPLVSICTLAYNHEPYIRQCLEGFMIQKCNFKFEVLIHDDASTDGTAGIIREYEEKYPEIIKPIYQKENQYSQGIFIGVNFQYPRVLGKYIALCEGDDYWTDPLKLQKQVDFLEANSEYGMCYTQCKRFNQELNKFEKNNWGGPFESFSEFWKQNCVPTLTVVYRKDLCMKYVEDVLASNHNWKMGDYPMWLWFAYESKIKFFKEVTGVYRVLRNSATHNVSLEKNLEFMMSLWDIKEYFNKKFSLNKNKQFFERNRWFMYLRTYSLYANFKSFIQVWLSGVFKNPSYLLYRNSYKYFLFFFLPELKYKKGERSN